MKKIIIPPQNYYISTSKKKVSKNQKINCANGTLTILEKLKTSISYPCGHIED
jgi:hypothetical protein